MMRISIVSERSLSDIPDLNMPFSGGLVEISKSLLPLALGRRRGLLRIQG
jgi:hypothetical protein